MDTITFGIYEKYETIVSREPITINISDYPELEGKTQEEIINYLIENYFSMKPSKNSEYLASLYDELMEQDIIREKFNDERTELYFD